MKKISILLTVFTAAMAFTACNKSADAPHVQSDEIIFSSDYNLEYNVQTKTTAVTSLSSFNASAVTGSAGSETAVWTNVSFTDAGESRYAGDRYWPLTNDNPYRFYASNATLVFAATGNTVTVTTDTDVICAYSASPTYKEVNALTFNHIFARIGDMTVSAASGYTITDVSISITPKTSGTYNLLTGNGQSDGTGWSSTSNGSAYSLAAAAPGTKSNDLYLVPGTYTLTASWTATRGDYTQTFSNKTYDVSIVGGKINSISTTLGGLAEEIKFTVSITPWGSNSVEATFPLN